MPVIDHSESSLRASADKWGDQARQCVVLANEMVAKGHHGNSAQYYRHADSCFAKELELRKLLK